MRVVEALERWGHSWLYDVQLLAGQPEGTITDSGSKGWELWTFALHACGVPKVIAFNTFVLAISLSCPVLIYAAAWVRQPVYWRPRWLRASGFSIRTSTGSGL